VSRRRAEGGGVAAWWERDDRGLDGDAPAHPHARQQTQLFTGRMPFLSSTVGLVTGEGIRPVKS